MKLFENNLVFHFMHYQHDAICNVFFILLIACNFQKQPISARNSKNHMELVTKQYYKLYRVDGTLKTNLICDFHRITISILLPEKVISFETYY